MSAIKKDFKTEKGSTRFSIFTWYNDFYPITSGLSPRSGKSVIRFSAVLVKFHPIQFSYFNL